MASALKNAPVAAVQDDDARSTTAKDWQGAVLSRSLPELSAKLALKRATGRPKSMAPKQATTIRLSPDVMAAFKATGAGWQTRIDAALKDWLRTHSPV